MSKEGEYLKIPKYSAEVDFDFMFYVKSYIDKRDSDFYLTVYVSNKNDKTYPAVHNILVKDVTVVGFIGDKEESYVIVSNELIHQFISAKKNSNSKLYWYFYLKENSDYVQLSDNIFLSNVEFENLTNQFGKFAIEIDPKIMRRKFSGSFPARVLGNSETYF